MQKNKYNKIPSPNTNETFKTKKYIYWEELNLPVDIVQIHEILHLCVPLFWFIDTPVERLWLKRMNPVLNLNPKSCSANIL